ncbi:MAG: hypothetical protein LQ351_001198 [Letrouitia transgressa]|nr:MAG: hypothetical protein LQ351_001198 [Letrouitia transgressa]
MDASVQGILNQDQLISQQQLMSLDEEIEVLLSRIRNLCNDSIDPVQGQKYRFVLPKIPVVDLSRSFSNDIEARRHVAAQIRMACETVGFFLISNHGLPTEVTDGILNQTKRFFHQLSTEQKEAMHQRGSKLFKGFEKDEDIYGNGTRNETDLVETRESFNNFYEPSFEETGGDGKYIEMDGFPINYEDPTGLKRANFWPKESDLPGFKAGFRSYFNQVQTLAIHLTRMIALSLELPEGYFDSMTKHPGGMLKIIHYPPQSAEVLRRQEGQGKLGLLAHADQEFLTILLTSGAPGLEILLQPLPETDNHPVWITVPKVSGTLVINVGDGLARLTNDRYKSAVHRVVARAPDGQDVEARYSVPYFFNLDFDAMSKHLPEHAVGRSHFTEVTNGEYIWTR